MVVADCCPHPVRISVDGPDFSAASHLPAMGQVLNITTKMGKTNRMYK